MNADIVLEKIGREIVGPAFAVYLHRVVERSESLKLDRLMFLAREGLVFRELYDKIAARTGTPLPTHYLYVSRLSTAAAAVRRYGLRELRLAWRRPGRHTPRALFKTFDLDESSLLPHLYAAGFVSAEEPITDWWGETRFDRLLDDEDFQSLVAAQCDAQRSRLREYLAGEGFFDGQRMGLVDIGWTGTIQDALHRAFPEPSVYGLYFGLKLGGYSAGDTSAFARKEGLFVDFRRRPTFAREAPFAFLELFEQAARARHGTTLRYEWRGGAVVPVLSETGPSRMREHESDSLVEAMQRGVLEAVDAYVADFPSSALVRIESIANAVERLVHLPTTDEITALAQLNHSVDWGDEAHRELMGELVLNPRRLWRDFHASAWRAAFLHRLGGPVLPRLYRGYLARRK